MPHIRCLRRSVAAAVLLAAGVLTAGVLAAGVLTAGLLATAAVAPAHAQSGAQAQAPSGQPPLPLEPLEIATRNGVVTFEVEVARTVQSITMGLMYRRELGERRGMLFDFKDEQPVSMWMKNTLIPLDMLFIRSNGTISRIAANTTPLSTATIPSNEPVQAVLEIAGGAAKRLGIAPGDRVAHPLLSGR